MNWQRRTSDEPASFLKEWAQVTRMEELSTSPMCVSLSCQFEMAAAVGFVGIACFALLSRTTIAGKDSPDRGVGALFSQREGRDTRRADARHTIATPHLWQPIGGEGPFPRREFLSIIHVPARPTPTAGDSSGTKLATNQQLIHTADHLMMLKLRGGKRQARRAISNVSSKGSVLVVSI